MQRLESILADMQNTLNKIQTTRSAFLTDNVFDDKATPQLLQRRNTVDADLSSPMRKASKIPSRKFDKIPDFDLESNFKNKRKNSVEEDIQFYKICFTGGPCAGKTTALTEVSESLRELGFTVFVVPEAASLIFSGGGDLDLSNYDDYSALKFQYMLLQLQKCLEDIYSELALLNRKKVVVLCDRGVMDGSAYLTADQWKTLIDEWDLDVVRMRDRRYDMVVHLVTAADGAEEFYSSGLSGTNKARVENLESAIKLDKKIQQSWMAHPLFVIVDNRSGTEFNDKIKRIKIHVHRLLGFPTSVNFNNKFLIKNNDGKLLDKLQNYGLVLAKFTLCDTFIKCAHDGATVKHHSIRKRYGDDVRKTFIKKKNEFVKGNDGLCEQKVELRRQISWKEYKSYEQMIKKDTRPVIRERATFLWKSQSLIVDCYNFDEYSFAVLSVLSERAENKLQKPEILQNLELREISDQEIWHVHSIAKIGWQPPTEIMDEVLRKTG